MYKLIALDMDGTLLNDEKKITQKTKQELQRLVEKDIKIVMCTARPIYRIRDYLEELNLMKTKQYTVAFNGSVIYENLNFIKLTDNFLTKEQISEILKLAMQIKIYTALYYENGKIEKSEVNSEIEIFEDISEREIYKIVFFDNPESIKHIYEEAKSRLGSICEITNSESTRIEFVQKRINKAKALEYICKINNIDSKDVIAIGDGDNDIDMIKFAGLGVAMGNAVDELKYIADYVTNSNNEDGIANVLQRFFVL